MRFHYQESRLSRSDSIFNADLTKNVINGVSWGMQSMDITRINDFILKMFFSESWWGVQFQYVPVSPVDIAIYGKPQLHVAG